MSVSTVKTNSVRPKVIATLFALACAIILLPLLIQSAEFGGNVFSAQGLAGGAAQTEGMTAVALFLLIAASTFVSEDLTCVGAGVLAAQGRVGFAFAALSCLTGIFVGDLLLFLAGRYLGRPALARAPLSWFVREDDVERGSEWFRRRGAAVIMLSRFAPGTRLPTYFAAGLLDTSLLKFSLYFLAAAAVWTPALVGLSMIAGAQATESSLAAGRGALFALATAALAVFTFVRLLVRLSTWRGRRLFAARLRRLARWEFWPPWAFYPPVLVYILFLAIKYRGLSFTCANPAIPAGGFVGESKIEILRGLWSSPGSRPLVARAELIEATLPATERARKAREFIARENLSLPVALKPDAGERGKGVSIVRTESQLEAYLSEAEGDTIIQEYAPGAEFGVFYVRHPGEPRGRVFSVTDKRFPAVVGDGASTLEELILKDPRAVLMARTHLERHRDKLDEVPPAGEQVTLVELGTHCRGALFLEGGWVLTPELEESVERLARGFGGFCFGRFDIRTPSVEDFRRGENFKVVELNGVTSEATSIYDPRNGLLTAYRVIFEQWRLAFEIGAANRARGARQTPAAELCRLILACFRRGGGRASTPALKSAALKEVEGVGNTQRCASDISGVEGRQTT